MKKKEAERQKAIELRKTGMSLNDIARSIGVSKSSVSIWVRHVNLTDSQTDVLALKRGQQVRSRLCKDRRQQWRDIGISKAKERDLLHHAGCMLYWAEGWKSQNRNSIRFVNTDPEMISLFVKFLRQSLGVEDSAILLKLQCYRSCDRSVEDTEDFWLSLVGLSRSNLRKTTIRRGKAEQKKSPMGVCSITVHSTELMQHLYGAIQEYVGFSRDKWNI